MTINSDLNSPKNLIKMFLKLRHTQVDALIAQLMFSKEILKVKLKVKVKYSCLYKKWVVWEVWDTYFNLNILSFKFKKIKNLNQEKIIK